MIQPKRPNQPKSSIFHLLCLLAAFLFLPDRVQAQTPIMDDKVLTDSIRKAVDLMYNFQFDKADNCIKRFRPKYGNHPGFLLFNGLSLYWKHFPILSHPAEFKVFMATMNQVIALGDKMEGKYPKSPEPVFYQMLGNLMMARHHAEGGEYIKAVNETRKAYTFIKKGFELQKTYSDFYLTTGLFNYFREAYPNNHPTYKPFTVFFPDGNKTQGLKDLEVASQKSLFSRAEALMYLSAIQLRDEYNPVLASKYSTQLYESYPNNWLYNILHAEILIETKRNDLAEPLVTKLLMRTEPVALLAGYYLKGLIEVSENKPDAAKWAFQKAISYGKGKDKVSQGFKGLSCGELGKIAYDEGKRDWVKKYFKQALDLCTYRKVKQDAKRCGY